MLERVAVAAEQRLDLVGVGAHEENMISQKLAENCPKIARRRHMQGFENLCYRLFRLPDCRRGLLARVGDGVENPGTLAANGALNSEVTEGAVQLDSLNLTLRVVYGVLLDVLVKRPELAEPEILQVVVRGG